MSEIILGLFPQPEEPKPFAVEDAHNKIIMEIQPEDFWQHGPDAMTSTNQLEQEIEGET